MNKEFIRVRSVKDYIISSLLVVGGLLLSMIPESELLAITGCFLVFSGIFVAVLLKTGYMDTETGIKYRKTEKYFQQALHAALSDAIVSDPGKIDLSQEDKGNALKLDIYFNKSVGKAYLQLFEYVPYRYEPCSAVVEHEIDKVNNLIK